MNKLENVPLASCDPADVRSLLKSEGTLGFKIRGSGLGPIT